MTSLRRSYPLLLSLALLLLSLFAPHQVQGESSGSGLRAAAPSVASGVPHSECFPVERLPDPLRRKAEALLLKLLDSEALYTIIGGLKPVSSAFASYQFETAKPDLAQLDEARRILDTFHCGDEFFADLLVFAREYTGKRHAHAFIAHRGTLASTIRRHTGFFAPYGISPATHPVQAVYAVEYAPPADRSRGYGYLYGYPDHAVDFFVQAEDTREKTGKAVPREFLNIPTYGSERGKFVWAVPKGYVETAEDRRIRERAAAILAAYRERRAHYIGEGKPGPAALLRDWFDDGAGRCASANARLETRVPQPSSGS